MKLEIIKKIGGGGSGQVYQVLKNGKDYALKVWRNFDEGEELAECISDLDVLFGLDSPYTIKGYDIYAAKDLSPLYERLESAYIGVTIDLMAGEMSRSLYQSLDPSIKFKTMIKMFNDVWNGINDVYRFGYYNLDIRPPNILVSSDLNRFYSADYGYSNKVSSYVFSSEDFGNYRCSPFMDQDKFQKQYLLETGLQNPSKKEYLRLLLFTLAISCLDIMGRVSRIMKPLYFEKNGKYYVDDETRDCIFKVLDIDNFKVPECDTSHHTLVNIVIQALGIQEDGSFGLPKISEALYLDETQVIKKDSFIPNLKPIEVSNIIQLVLISRKDHLIEEIYLAIEYYLRLYDKIKYTPLEIAQACLFLASLNRTKENPPYSVEFIFDCVDILKGNFNKNIIYKYINNDEDSELLLNEFLIDGEFYLHLRQSGLSQENF